MALVHSFYRSSLPSGENSAVLQQFELLEEAGADVTLISVSTDELMQSALYPVRTAARVARHAGEDPTEALEMVDPDIVHLHNTFPNISSRWLRKRMWPLVGTIHNYRPVCSAGTLSRDGELCTDCVDTSTLSAIRHRCYRDSVLASTTMAIRTRQGTAGDPVLHYADQVLVPNDFMKETYAEIGFPNAKVLYQPSTLSPISMRDTGTESGSWTFIGRLTPEKGLVKLLSSWPKSERLVVLGDGPEMVNAQKISTSRGLSIDFRGFVKQSDLALELANSRGLVIPSIWREGAPLVYGDAMALGTPVVALQGSSVSQLVLQDGTGVVMSGLDSQGIERALKQLDTNSLQYQAHCQSTYVLRYDPGLWLRSIRDIYSQVHAGLPGRGS